MKRNLSEILNALAESFEKFLELYAYKEQNEGLERIERAIIDIEDE